MVTFMYPVVFKLGLLKEGKHLERNTYYHEIVSSNPIPCTILLGPKMMYTVLLLLKSNH